MRSAPTWREFWDVATSSARVSIVIAAKQKQIDFFEYLFRGLMLGRDDMDSYQVLDNQPKLAASVIAADAQMRK